MIDALLRTSIARRWIVMFLVAAIGALGIWNYQRLPIDAVPDITNVQVQINAKAQGYTPLEIESRITTVLRFPLVLCLVPIGDATLPSDQVPGALDLRPLAQKRLATRAHRLRY